MRRFGRVACLILALTAGCGGQDDARSAPDRPGDAAGGKRTTFTLHSDGPSAELFMPVVYNLPHMHMLFRPLFRWSREGERVGDLVRDWDVSEDGRAWTYRLRTDVRWHDGTPFTSRDVALTVDLYQHPEFLARPPGSAIATVVDDSTVQIEYLQAGRWDPLETYAVILPSHLMEDLDPAEYPRWAFWDAPVGNGPFRFVREEEWRFVELEANPDFHGGRPAIDRVILRYGGGGGYLELLAGNVDAVPLNGITEEQAALLAEDQRFSVYYGLSSGPGAIVWNPKNPKFADARVRRALSIGLDRREIAAFMDYPPGLEPFDLPATNGQQRRDELPRMLEYDAEGARGLLTAAGWRDRDGDGIVEKGGQPLEIELWLDPEVESLGLLVQEQLRRIGVRVTLAALDRRALRDRFRRGAYEAALGVRVPLSELLLGPEGTGVAELRPPDLRAILTRLAETIHPRVRDSLFREMWPILREETPATFLIPRLFVSAARANVRGLETPHRIAPEANLDQLWIEEDSS